jgi:hypothetical protein
MKLYLLILMLVLAVNSQLAFSQQGKPPLTESQVTELVKFGMEAAKLAEAIKQQGLDFEPTEDYLKGLRKAGAQEVVIQALRDLMPLTQEQVGQLVAGGVTSERTVALVKQHGVNFHADEEYLKTLRLAGGDESLIAAVREASLALVVVKTNQNGSADLTCRYDPFHSQLSTHVEGGHSGINFKIGETYQPNHEVSRQDYSTHAEAMEHALEYMYEVCK